MKTSLALAALAALFLTAGCGNSSTALSPAKPKTYTLRVKEDKGAKFTYDMEMQMTMLADDPEKKAEAAQNNLTATGTMDVEVLSVAPGKITFRRATKIADAKGTGIFQLVVDQAKNSMNSTTESTIDEMGNAVQGAKSSPNVQSLQANFPEGAVKVGDSWEAKLELEPGKPTTVKVLLAAEEKVDGVDALRLELNLVEAGDLNLIKPISIWIDPSNGRALKTEAEMEAVQNGMKMSVMVKQTMAKPKPAA